MHTSRRKIRHHRPRRSIEWLEFMPLLVFGLLVLLGPLLFGAVDRPVQIGLVLLLATGLLLQPPMLARLSTAANVFIVGLIAMALAQAFAPHPWFGGMRWRSELAGNLGVQLPWTHHPEPARAVDAILAAAIAAVWFQWARTLAANRVRRIVMAWMLVLAGAFLALVCFTMKGAESGRIFGIRETPGWVGWGPFPNRNHTASFLSMAALTSAGCVLWAIAKQRRALAVVGFAAFVGIFSALLASKSRGALVAFGAGLAVLLALVLIKNRDRRSLVIVLTTAMVIGALVLAYGGQVLHRFASQEAGMVSNELRRTIWRDGLSIWRDAPLFGHGLDTFAGIFPIYSQSDFDGKRVLHPESSWLLWLVEFGAVPLALLVVAFLWFVAGNLRPAFKGRRGFYLTAGALAAVAALVAHAAVDVPAHRWATAGVALALLAIAFPSPNYQQPSSSRRVALLPLGVAMYWLIPYLVPVAWAPVQVERLISRETGGASQGPRPTLAEWQAAVRHFPLEPLARQYAALRTFETNPRDRAAWERDFAICRRLAGSSWEFPVKQAMAVARWHPSLAIAYWQDAVERSGRNGPEVLRAAVTHTSGAPSFASLWGQYIETNPALGFAYARALVEELREPHEDARPYFDLWWEHRALTPEVTDPEARDFYQYAARWATAELLEKWMRAHAARRKTDFRQWASLLAGWSHHQRAWTIYAGVVSDPAFGSGPRDVSRDTLEAQWLSSPGNFSYAQRFAEFLHAAGDSAGAAGVVAKAAAQPDAPAWFIRKAAFELAGRQQFAEALALALREKP
jgi:O-antigen ligase